MQYKTFIKTGSNQDKFSRLCLTWLGMILLLCLGLACGDSSSSSPSQKPIAVCTTTMIADMAKNLAAGRLEIIGLMRAGEDPHIYRPKPMDAVQIAQAKILLCNGLHLEGTLDKIIHNNLAAGAVRVALAEDPQIKPLESEGFKGAPDPHCWFNVAYFKIYAEKCRDAFIAADPAGKEAFTAAAAKYLAALTTLHDYVRTELATIPKERRILITSHDAFQYFGQAYDVEVHALIGISTEQEPKPQDVEALGKLVIQKKVKAVFIETSVSSKLNTLLQKVSTQNQITVGGTLYSDSLADEGSPAGSYIGMVRHNVDIIVKALK